MRARLAAVTLTQAREAGERSAVHVSATARWHAARGVLVYAAVHGEVDAEAVARAAWRAGKRVFLPNPRPAELALAPVGWPEGGALVPGPYDIPVVAAGGAGDGAGIDLALVPGVAFDRQGGRLGSGLGYYDRWLGAHPDVLPVGLAYAWQVVAALPVAGHDVRMAALATPDGVWPCGAAAP